MDSAFSDQEKAALSEFRVAIADLIETFDDYEAHNENLIRWLRAKELNVQEAEAMIRHSMKWRDENDFKRFRDLPVSDYYLEKLPFRPSGYDKEGALVIIIPVIKWEMSLLTKSEHHAELTTYIFHIMDKLYHYLKATSTPEKIRTKVVLIIDIEGFSLQELLSKHVIDFFVELLKLYEAHSPERMKAVYVINISSFFSVFWPVIKPFIQTRTLSKVHIVGGGPEYWKPAILTGIDPRELPSEYGGTNSAHPAAYSNDKGETWPARAAVMSPGKFVTAVIPARDKFVTGFDLNVGNRISWNFKTEFYDIGFSFMLNDVPMFPSVRADGHVFVQDGCVDIVEAGTYSLVFDNTYSMFRSKTVHYAIEIEDKVEPEE
ncbi:unnamed protein product [Allacma fusca]|uniref:Uncharacterized protein n=1 Tax=Allacma fusca TaxID=39272 RepID=A0A8J2K8W1_9HEXA|nr:unnamed protein product [Allacma fusca]